MRGPSCPLASLAQAATSDATVQLYAVATPTAPANGQASTVAIGSGGVYLSTDGAQTFSPVQTSLPTATPFTIATSADGTRVLVGGAAGPLIMSTGGPTGKFAAVNTGTGTGASTNSWQSVAMSGSGGVMAAVNAANNYLYISSNGGSTWTKSFGGL